MNTWYLEFPATENISQGDILTNCPVFLNLPELDPASPDKIGAIETKVDTIDVVVMNQACDLEDCDLDSLIVVPLWDPLSITIKGLDEADPEKEKNKRWDFIASVHAGRRPNYALIGKSDGDIKMGYKIVDFSNIFSLPYQFLMSFREIHGSRLRLNTPHRELLSQQFGNYFTRIGIPNEDFINKTELKKDLFL